MRGVAVTHAAVSVVNALPLGVGAAFAVDWRARALVRPAPDAMRSLTIEPRGAGTPLVRLAATAALRRLHAVDAPIRLELRSTIPRGRGLKSSSAVVGAVAWATSRSLGEEPKPLEIPRLAAGVERESGRSATGAFDDAAASAEGGGVVCDNRTDRLLRRFELGPGLGVALWIPASRHPPSRGFLGRFRRHRRLAQRAVDAALDGDWGRAMAANTAVVEGVMGYRYGHLHAAAREAGAIASGVSGLGPTLAAVAPVRRLRRVLSALPRNTGARNAVRPVSRRVAHGRAEP